MPTFKSINTYVGDGVTTRWNFAFSGGYLAPDHVFIEINGELTPAILDGSSTVVIEPAIASGQSFVIRRLTPNATPLVNWADGADISEANLDTATRQSIFSNAEFQDNNDDIKTRTLQVAPGTVAPEVADLSAAEGLMLAVEGGKIVPVAANIKALNDAVAAAMGYRNTSLTHRNAAEAAVQEALAAKAALEATNLGIVADFASNDSDKGAAKIGLPGGGNLRDYVEAVVPVVQPTVMFDGDGYPSAPVDSLPAVQAAVDFAAANGINKVKIRGQRGTILFGGTLLVPFGIEVDFGNSRAANTSEYEQTLRIMPLKTGTFRTLTNNGTVTPSVTGNAQSGYLMFFNVDPANTSTWKRAFPNIGCGGLKNAHIDGTATSGVSVAYFAGSYQFENVRLRKVATFAAKPSGVYTDGISIKHIFSAHRANDTDFLIYLPGMGDAYEIDTIATGYLNGQVGVTKSVHVGACRSGTISRVVNGIIELKNATMTVLECHIEGGQVISDGGDNEIRRCKFYNGDSALIPIVATNSNNSSGDHGSLEVSGCQFIHYINGVSDKSGWSTTDKLDISIQTGRMDVLIGRKNVRVSAVNGEIGRAQLFAPLVGETTTVYPDWINHAPMLAKDGAHISSGRVEVSGTLPALASWTGFTVANRPGNALNPARTFAGPTGTHYYAVELWVDGKRLLGRSPLNGQPQEQSIATANGSTNLPQITLDYANTRTGLVTAVIYRGTASGVYDKVAYVPMVSADRFTDDGNAIGTFAWKSRTPGAKAALNNGGLNGDLRYTAGVLSILNAALTSNPSTGTWVTGDSYMILGQSPAHASRLCTAGGSPGTFVRLGILDGQQAVSVTAPTGGATVDAESRSAISSILSALKSAKLMA